MTDDVGRGVTKARRRQRLIWIGVAALVGLLLAVFSSGLFLYAVIVAAGTFGTAVLLANVGARRLRIERRLSRSSVEPGEQFEVTLTVENRHSLPAPWLLCRDRVEDGLEVDGGTAALKTLGSGEKATISYRLSAARRGLYRVGPSVTEASDPLGFVRRFLVDESPRFVTVYPRTVPLGDSWPLGHNLVHRTPRRRSLFEDPSRLIGVREYRTGDSRRRIHWRATARTEKLQVKVFQPAVLQGALLAVDAAPDGAAGPGDGPGGRSEAPSDDRSDGASADRSDGRSGDRSEDGAGDRFELAVTAAASIAEYVLSEGQSVGLVSNGGDAAERYPRHWGGETFHRIEEAEEEAERRDEVSGYRPLTVPPGSGSWQRDRVRSALARLVPATGVSLAELLELELPRLPRSLVLIVVTGRLDEELTRVLDSLGRSGFEIALVWIRPAIRPAPGRPGAGAAGKTAAEVAASRVANGAASPTLRLPPLPEGIPVHAIADEQELENLGAHAL